MESAGNSFSVVHRLQAGLLQKREGASSDWGEAEGRVEILLKKRDGQDGRRA